MEKHSTPELSLGNLKDELIEHLMQELCTPLTNIKTALKLLESPAIKPPQRQRYLGLIGGECQMNHIVWLIHQRAFHILSEQFE